MARATAARRDFDGCDAVHSQKQRMLNFPWFF